MPIGVPLFFENKNSGRIINMLSWLRKTSYIRPNYSEFLLTKKIISLVWKFMSNVFS